MESYRLLPLPGFQMAGMKLPPSIVASKDILSSREKLMIGTLIEALKRF